MKKILLLLFIISTLLFSFQFSSAEEEREIKIRVYGHVYNKDKNNPIKNLSVYLKKNGKILTNGNTNKEGLYDLLTDNRSDYLNLCVESNKNTSIKNIDYCVTISVFQKLGRIVSDIELREIEYDFYTNSRGENLNERYEEEVTNKSTEENFDEYQDTIIAEREKEEIQKIEEEKRIELDKLKADYKMVSNTEMSGPLDTMHIIGTIKTLSGSTTDDFDYNRTYIIILDHYGNKLKEERLNKYYDFNITVYPKKEKVFLHPVNLKIENREYIDIEGEKIQKFKPEYRLITKEKNIVNIRLSPKIFEESDRTLYIKEKLPLINIILIIGLIIVSTILVIQSRIHSKRNDY